MATARVFASARFNYCIYIDQYTNTYVCKLYTFGFGQYNRSEISPDSYIYISRIRSLHTYFIVPILFILKRLYQAVQYTLYSVHDEKVF